MKRAKNLRKVCRGDAFDLVIIGGGASGLGTAVDAAARGYKVALFEQADFAKGTSSRSTKLIHGGVRYLQQGNISLVLEALRERGRLAKNAPHLVHSQAFVIPVYSWWEGPFYGIGMKVYDQLAGRLGLARSRRLTKEQTLEHIPTVESRNLVGGVIYHDGQFDDARLAVNLAQTAEEHGAAILNYCRCIGLTKEPGRVSGVEIRDMETGAEFSVRANAVINATGVFVDELRQIDDPQAREIIAVSQGVHIVLPKHFLPGDSAMMIPKTEDGRVLFAVPWHDHIIVGTTDTPLDQKSLEPRALEEEREFIMTHAARYLSRAPTPADVLSIFAGLRPLVRSRQGKNTSEISRDHSIMVSDSGLITLTGGKWTTYRKMAEDVIGVVEALTNKKKSKCPTRNLPIHGWTKDQIPEKHLRVYGSDAMDIRNLLKAKPELAGRIHPRLPYQTAEVVWQVRNEMARTVEDVLARRTRALLLNAQAAIEAAPAVATHMASELGRNESWQKQQIKDFRQVAEGYLFE